MALAIKKNTAIGIMTETTEGTAVPPAAVTDYVQTQADGVEVSPSRELVDRNINNFSIGRSSPRVGMSQVSASIPVELRANATEGSAPEADKLYKATLGNRRQITTTTTTKASGNTGSSLKIEDADISKFTVDDIVLIKESGAYHVSPISSVTTTPGSGAIGLLIAKPTGVFSNSVVISKTTTYIVADSGHPSLTISKYIEDAVLERATGCRVNSMSIENFSTGGLPTVNFGLEGLNYTRTVSAIPHTPTYDAGKAPIILEGGVYMDAAAITVNDITLNIELGLGFETGIEQANGRKSSRVTERTITGTFNPYYQTDSVANYTKYSNNTPFSLFVYAKVPTTTPGEFGQVVAIYLKNCIITELGQADQDGHGLP